MPIRRASGGAGSPQPFPGLVGSAKAAKKTTRKAASRKKPRRRVGKPKPTAQPAAALRQPGDLPRESTGRLTPAQKRLVPSRACLVRVLCGCEGTFLPAPYSRVDGDYPYVSVRVITGCTKGHPERVGSGVIARFPPYAVLRIGDAQS